MATRVGGLLLTVNCADSTSSGAEDEVIRTLQDCGVKGTAFSNLLTGGRNSREIDLLVVTESGRLIVVEVKKSMTAGHLRASANSEWLVDGHSAYFYGGGQPHRQAKVAAAIVAKTLGKASVRHPWVEWVVVVSGPVLLDQPQEVDNGWVCLPKQLPEFLSRPSKQSNSNPRLVEELHRVFDIPKPMSNNGSARAPKVDSIDEGGHINDSHYTANGTGSGFQSSSNGASPVYSKIADRSMYNRFWKKHPKAWSKARRRWTAIGIWFAGIYLLSALSQAIFGNGVIRSAMETLVENLIFWPILVLWTATVAALVSVKSETPLDLLKRIINRPVTRTRSK
jgi:hypothetical protein